MGVDFGFDDNVSDSKTERGGRVLNIASELTNVTTKECGNRDMKWMDREDRATSTSEGEREKRKGAMR